MCLCEKIVLLMFQKQAKGKKKEGNRGEGGGKRVDENNFGKVSRKSGWSVRMRNAMPGYQ